MTARLQSDTPTLSLNSELLPFTEVLFVAKSEESAREDRRILRRTGFRSIRFFSSSVEVIQYIIFQRKNLNASYSCIVICHEQLSDMDARAFVSLLRLHPLGAAVPSLVILGDGKKAEDHEEKYKPLGVFEVLARPLTPNAIFLASQGAHAIYETAEKKRRALIVALEKASPELQARYSLAEQEKIKLFDVTLSRFSYDAPLTMSCEQAYTEGCAKLNDKLYDQAWRYFKRAISADSLYKPLALFGLYKLYKERQEDANAKIYLIQSCQAFIDVGQWIKVEECVMCFSKEYPKSSHPILGMITTAIKRSDTEQLQLLLNASTKHVSSEDISRSIVTGCFHYELSSDIMRVLSTDINVFTRVLELLQDRKLERQRREQEISLQKASMARSLAIIESQEGDHSHFSGNDKVDRLLSHYTLSDPSFFADKDVESSQSKSFFDWNTTPIEGEVVKKETVRLGVGSRGSIESLPLIVLDERHKGSFLGDIFRIAKQTAKIYRKSK